MTSVATAHGRPATTSRGAKRRPWTMPPSTYPGLIKGVFPDDLSLWIAVGDDSAGSAQLPQAMRVFLPATSRPDGRAEAPRAASSASAWRQADWPSSCWSSILYAMWRTPSRRWTWRSGSGPTLHPLWTGALFLFLTPPDALSSVLSSFVAVPVAIFPLPDGAFSLGGTRRSHTARTGPYCTVDQQPVGATSSKANPVPQVDGSTGPTSGFRATAARPCGRG